MHRLKSFGGLTLADDSGLVATLPRRRLALLALVASGGGRGISRERVVALLWPDNPSESGRHSLDQLLSLTRRQLGEDVFRGSDPLGLNPAVVSSDVAGFEAALATSDPASAVGLYAGPFLDGFYLNDAGEFERWSETERVRLAQLYRDALIRLAREDTARGDPLAAVGWWRRFVVSDPLGSLGAIGIMRALVAAGDRPGAMQHARVYEALIRQQLEMSPDPSVTALVAELRRTSEPRAPNATVTSASPAASRSNPPYDSAGEGAEQLGAPQGPRRQDANAPPDRREMPPLRNHVLRNAIVVGISVVSVVGIGWRMRGRSVLPAIGTSTPLTIDDGLQIEPAISPNGRLVAYAKGNSQRMRIFVHNIAGGAPWALTLDSNSVELLPRWSPDNDQLLFLAQNNAYVAPARGGSPRLVAAGGDGDASVRSATWSPNGDSVAIVRNDSLTIKPLDGPGSRFVGRGSQLHSCAWSPDGRWIACVSGNWIAYVPGTTFGNRAPSSLVLFPAAGGPRVSFPNADKEYLSPAWSTDSRFLWVLSNRDGPSGEVYAIPIGHDGSPDGPVRRIGLGGEAESISLSAGRIAYSVNSRTANVWSVPIPAGRPSTMGDAVRVTLGNQIVDIVRASWDGKWLIYDSNGRGNSDIYRMPIAGGPPERLTDDPREEFAGDLSPDGRQLVYHRWVSGVRRLFIKHLETGVVEAPACPPGDNGVPRWSPDGSTLVVWDHTTESGAIFVIHRGADGRWNPPSRRLVNAQLPVWSPDGKSIAFLTLAGSIESIGADSGARRVIYAPQPESDDPIATYLAWDAGRTDIWFLGHNRAGRGGVWAVPIRGGRPRLVVDFKDELGRVNGRSVTSDGKRFYFTLDDRVSNVRWAELVGR